MRFSSLPRWRLLRPVALCDSAFPKTTSAPGLFIGTTPSADTRRFGGGGMAARNGRWQPPPPPSQVMMVEAVATSAGESRGDSGGEERWRFQAEILRAECNFLRMEREVALRKLERNRTEMEIALKSTMETLGRKKIDGCGSVGPALDEEIEEVEEKLEELELGNSNRRKRSTGSSRKLLRGSCRGDFDRRAFMLRRQLKKMDEDTSVKDIQEISVQAFANKGPEAERHEPEDHDVAAYSNHNGEAEEEDGGDVQRDVGEAGGLQEEEKMGLLSCCSCKEVVGRIVQQVRAETEQWSEMQEMVEQVRVEMEELRSSRDHWHRRAIASEINFHSQHTQVSSPSQ
ncbi:hypothetical protein BHM03_00031467 [Ensete ventricosum]|nr:hypothetical protein BHM03_00031467 [Ensete ventricosum]